MTEIDELAQVDFSPIEVTTFTVAEWRSRAQDEFNNYHFLVEVLKRDRAGLVQMIEGSDDHEMWVALAMSFDKLSGTPPVWNPMTGLPLAMPSSEVRQNASSTVDGGVRISAAAFT